MSSTDLTVQPAAFGLALPGATEWNGMVAIADTLAQSEIVPKAYRNRPHDILAAGLLGRGMGLDLMQSLQYVNVIEGKAAVAPELMNARIRAQGHRVRVIEWTSTVCRIGITRRGETEENVAEFTIEDARVAGLLETKSGRPGAWQKYPRSMLWARVLSLGAKAYVPDAILGSRYTPEELGADVDEDGVPLDTDGTAVSALPADLAARVEETAVDPTGSPRTVEEEEAEEVEVIHEEPAPAFAQPGGGTAAPAGDGGFAQPTPPPPPTPEQEHERAADDAFRNGWPFGKCKGGDPRKPDEVDDASLVWFVDNYESRDPKYADLDAKRKAWCTAELKRRRSVGAPTPEEARAAVRQPQSGTTHDELNAQAAAAAEADDYADIPFGRDGGPVETAATSSDFAPTSSTPEFPPAEDPADAPGARLGATWHNRMLDAMVQYGYATDLADAQRRIEEVCRRKAAAGESTPLNSWAIEQIAAFRKGYEQRQAQAAAT